MRIAWVFVALALFVGGAVLVWNYLDERQQKQEQTSKLEEFGRTEEARLRDEQQAEILAQPPIKVRASALTKAFDSNVVDAEAKYLRRKVLVDGWAKRVWKSVDGVTLLELKGHEWDTVQCAYVGDFGFLAKIRPGMRVNISGIVAAHDALHGVIVANCEVETYWER